MDMRILRHLLIAALLTTVALAGCATPEEEAGPDVVDDDVGVDDGTTQDDTLGEDDPGAGTDDAVTGERLEFVMIDGFAYECDDTLDNDGICDEFQFAEDATEEDTANAPEFTTEPDGTVVIQERTYFCEDVNNVQTGTEPTCEKYILESTA